MEDEGLRDYHVVLSRNSSGFQDARAAYLVVFSPLVHTPVLGGIEDVEGQRQRVRLGGLPVIATVTRLLCRELTLQNGYLLKPSPGAEEP